LPCLSLSFNVIVFSISGWNDMIVLLDHLRFLKYHFFFSALEESSRSCDHLGMSAPLLSHRHNALTWYSPLGLGELCIMETLCLWSIVNARCEQGVRGQRACIL
jgi:hypothetical protein